MIGFSRSSPKEPRSLNVSIRKQEALRISSENKEIITRIKQVNPSYSTDLMEQKYKQKNIILKNICENPFVLPSSPYSRSKSRPEDKVCSSFN